MAEVREVKDPFTGQTVQINNDLVRRLRGEYATGPTMPNGEPEFGWRKFGEPSPVHLEAAEQIERLRAALLKLADACDTVGVMLFDSDDMSPEVHAMQEATQEARAILKR